MKNIWKYVAGIVVVVLFVGYILFTRQSADSITQTVNPPVVENTGSSTTPTTTGTTGSGGGAGADLGGTNPAAGSGNTGGGTTGTGGTSGGTGGRTTGTGTGGTTGSTGGGTAGGGTTGTGSTGAYKNGAYTGSAEDAFYGTVQVAAVINGGKLTSVQILQAPNAPGHTTEVNSAAIPQLQQEALAAQSANVNIVSGATQTSGAFQQSLASALSQAKA